MLTGAFGIDREPSPFLPAPHGVAGAWDRPRSFSVRSPCSPVTPWPNGWVSAGDAGSMLCLAEAVVLWNVSVIWGHPEDAVAVGLALYALIFALDGRWTGAGWLIGAAMATQPLVVLMFPVVLALAGRGRSLALAVRATVPAVAVVAHPPDLAVPRHHTCPARPTELPEPRPRHALDDIGAGARRLGSGTGRFSRSGSGRRCGAGQCGLGWRARRWRQRPEMIVWAAALALARCGASRNR